MAAAVAVLLTFHTTPGSVPAALARLSGQVRAWFIGRFPTPTPAQVLAWPRIGTGQNCLISAPTGSGKTLAAFLPILDQLLVADRRGGVRCLYVSPLKALGRDVKRNLRRHVREIAERLGDACEPPRVGLRTGDTSQRVRKRQLADPPAILVTTPESLALLLIHPGANDLFRDLRWIIVDEVHALAASKRGADLGLSLERLECLASRPLQRIGLSATCEPLATAARFLVGAERPCAVIEARDRAEWQLLIEPLPDGGPAEQGLERGNFMARLLTRLDAEFERNRTTLIFTNRRSLAERLAWALRRRYPVWFEQIAVHHSAVATVRRRRVEKKLKAGALRIVVSSTSLELGIDIGGVDGVVLVHPPGAVTRLLQRIGRSGHGPGWPRRGLVLTANAAELLEAAVTAASSRTGQFEPLRWPAQPLDVLCQQLLGMAAQRTWECDEAYALVRRAAPYRNLSRTDFEECLAYLAGRDRAGRPWLPARILLDEPTTAGESFAASRRGFSISGERVVRLLRRNLGTILTEEPRAIQLGDGSAVGQVDEAFADRLRPGDRFVLDGRCLEYRRLDGPNLVVEEIGNRPHIPRWAGDAPPLSRELARRLYVLRVQAAEALRQGTAALASLLERDYELEIPAIRVLLRFFLDQETISEIPEVRVLLIERVDNGAGGDYFLHTPLNRAGNDALARVLVQRLRNGRIVIPLPADLGVLLSVTEGASIAPDEWRRLLNPVQFDADFADALEDSAALRERFRRVALIGLMLLKHPLGRQRRVGGQDWAQRRLFDQVRAADADFVLMRQAEHEIREELCDTAAAREFLGNISQMEIHCRPLARVSPFAENWTQAVPSPAELPDNPLEALERLQRLLVNTSV